jgi:hypothetical protein
MTLFAIYSMKINTRIFEVVTKNAPYKEKTNEIIEVWLPPVNHPEGEMVLCISTFYVPALIATLRGLPSANISRQPSLPADDVTSTQSVAGQGLAARHC